MNAPERTLEAAEEAPPPGVSRRAWRWATLADYGLEGVAVGLMIVVAVGFSAFAGRRALVGAIAEDYLRDRGVAAEVEVYEVDSRGFVARVRLGPEDDPDFQAERVIVGLAAPPPPEGPYALRPRVIRILRPQLKARWTGERLSFGSLDPLVEEFLSKPPEPDQPSPLVLVEQGGLRLATPYGLVRAGGSGVVDDSKLRRLDLTFQPADLKGRGFDARLAGGDVRLRSDGRAVDLRTRLDVRRLRTGAAVLGGSAFSLSGAVPYPDLEKRRMQGPVRLTASLASAEAKLGDTALPGLDAALRLNGDLAGPLDRVSFRGAGGGSLEADRLTAGAIRVEDPGARFQSRALVLTTGPDGIDGSGSVTGSASARRISSGDLRAEALAADFQTGVIGFRSGAAGADLSGPLQLAVTAASASAGRDLSAQRVNARVRTDLSLLKGGQAPVTGRAAAGSLRLTAADTPVTVTSAAAEFTGRAGAGGFAVRAALHGDAGLPQQAARRLVSQIPVLGPEPAYAAALTRAATRVSVDAPGVDIAQARGLTSAVLTRPVRLAGAGGVVGVLSPVPGRGVWNGRGGGFQLALHGGGAPDIDARVDSYELSSGGGLTADLGFNTKLDLAIARGAAITARGRATLRGETFEFRARDCVRVAADAVELGENDLQALSARLCPVPEAALIRASGGGYRARGRFQDASVTAPFLESRFSAASGALDATGAEAGLTAVAASVDSAEATDTAEVRRYHPAALTGTAQLAAGDWTAALDILDKPQGLKLGTAAIAHDVLSGEGRVLIAADDLVFTPEGLQPHDLSPLGVGMISKVEGAVDFAGELTWTETGGTSRGRLTTEGLDFDSPGGRVIGFGPAIEFSSLTPLIAPPGQVVRAQRVEAFSPLMNPEVRFGLTPEALQVESAAAGFAGGRLTLEPITVPITPGEHTLTGAVRLDDVDIGQLIEASSFADKVDFQAVVDGRLPFETGPGGLRFAGGELHSVRPGRVSIDREVLSGVQASGGPEAAPAPEAAPSTAFQDLAYDAMENLSYEEMQVAVDSRPEGRLGMIFQIRGRHDPPVAREARISILDLIRGRAFEKDIPLPKGTPVNLTLDTSINFDELLASYLELNRARGEGSDPVQR